MIHVKLAREPHNPKDESSILVILTQSGQVLGHLERKVWICYQRCINNWFVCSYHLQKMHSVLPSCFAILVSLGNKTA